MQSFLKNTCKGFTFIEVFFLILLVLVSVGMVFQLLYTSSVFETKLEGSQKNIRSVLDFNRECLTYVQDIRPAYWENKDQVFKKNSGSLTISYYQADKDKSLVFRANETSFEVNADGVTQTWGVFNKPSIDYWTVNDRIVGISFQFIWNGKLQVLHVPFGGQIL